MKYSTKSLGRGGITLPFISQPTLALLAILNLLLLIPHSAKLEECFVGTNLTFPLE